jgi:archaemetzincin
MDSLPQVPDKGPFVPPPLEEGIKAISVEAAPNSQTKLLSESIQEFFPVISAPQPGEWLESFWNYEEYETASQFDKALDPNQRFGFEGRNKIYLTTLGDFNVPSLELLCDYISRSIQVPCIPLPPVSLEVPSGDERKRNSTSKKSFLVNAVDSTNGKEYGIMARERKGIGIQLFTEDVFKMLVDMNPPDGWCTVAATMFDLYPGESWNFVFGQAHLETKTGVFSFVRYHPGFGTKAGTAAPLDADQEQHLTVLGCKILVHEILHLFYMRHCVYFECLINGANNQDEASKHPLYICPVCLHKLIVQIPGFDIKKHYQDLIEFYIKSGKGIHLWEEHKEWMQKRLESSEQKSSS